MGLSFFDIRPSVSHSSAKKVPVFLVDLVGFVRHGSPVVIPGVRVCLCVPGYVYFCPQGSGPGPTCGLLGLVSGAYEIRGREDE